MHTTNLSDDWYAIHNGDFSGDVKIGNLRLKVSVEVPFEVLKVLVAVHVRDSKISKLEQASDDEVLGLGKVTR